MRARERPPAPACSAQPPPAPQPRVDARPNIISRAAGWAPTGRFQLRPGGRMRAILSAGASVCRPSALEFARRRPQRRPMWRPSRQGDPAIATNPISGRPACRQPASAVGAHQLEFLRARPREPANESAPIVVRPRRPQNRLKQTDGKTAAQRAPIVRPRGPLRRHRRVHIGRRRA